MTNLFLAMGDSIERATFPGPLSCWLHLMPKYRIVIPRLVRKLVSDGCFYIAITGEDCAKIHDTIDEELIELGREDILTSWHSGSISTQAWEFLHLDLSNRQTLSKVAIVSGSSTAVELAGLSGVADALRVSSNA